MTEFTYDLIVIGSGPAGQRAAIQASKLGKKIALIEKKNVVGGVCTNTGTIPSKTLREAVMHLSGYRERSIYGSAYAVKQSVTMEDLLFRTNQVTRHEIDIIKHQLSRNGVELISAKAALIDSHMVAASSESGEGQRILSTDKIVIATGTRATKDTGIPFDEQNVFTSDDILSITKVPKSLVVVGAGVIGCEYACMFATLGVRVTLIDKRARLLPFVDHEISDTLSYQLRQQRVILRLGEEVSNLKVEQTDTDSLVSLSLKSGKKVAAEVVLYSIGRSGNTEDLNLEAVGLSVDDRGRIKVNSSYQTEVPNIYAVGDVIGFPSLASTSMEQGRIAACNAFDHPYFSMPEFFPYGIYTIPEISMVGQTEEELTQAGVPYEMGRASYREIARGQIIGDQSGVLKILFHTETRKLLGVHIMGEGASELVNIGQAVMSHNGSIDYFINSVFNFPTLAECYKTAAFDGINRLGHSPSVLKSDEQPVAETT
ncbi:MAG: Si-specific NAD(P)(+) transhydrogenase [candidate division Zixibacteria bacterium]